MKRKELIGLFSEKRPVIKVRQYGCLTVYDALKLRNSDDYEYDVIDEEIIKSYSVSSYGNSYSYTFWSLHGFEEITKKQVDEYTEIIDNLTKEINEKIKQIAQLKTEISELFEESILLKKEINIKKAKLFKNGKA